MGKNAGLMSGNGPEQVHHHAQRDRKGRNLIFAHHFGNTGRVAEMPGNDRAQQTGGFEAVKSDILFRVVAAADSGHHREVDGMPLLGITPLQGGE